MDIIDLRSDTVTHPTQNMRNAIMTALLGDDGYHDDPTTNELQSYIAKLFGKEAALFVPSGVFGNQLCIATHTQRGNEIILGDACHIIINEAGSSAIISGVQTRTLKSVYGGLINPDDISGAVRKVDDPHFPKTGLLCLENPTQVGKVGDLKYMERCYFAAKAHNIPVHLDGARLWNAAVHLGVEIKELTKYCDSVMCCFSKGLCAPFGSIVAGTNDFIQRAIKVRKMMGGQMRQVGVMAGPALVAVKE